jgi:hypothetical protein
VKVERSPIVRCRHEERDPAEFPGRLTGEVILNSDHYDLNEKAERHRREKEAVGRRPWWRPWRRRHT